eukprot:scaffold8374_cov175-Amphora_coffeaeformis.AAC.50
MSAADTEALGWCRGTFRVGFSRLRDHANFCVLNTDSIRIHVIYNFRNHNVLYDAERFRLVPTPTTGNKKNTSAVMGSSAPGWDRCMRRLYLRRTVSNAIDSCHSLTKESCSRVKFRLNPSYGRHTFPIGSVRLLDTFPGKCDAVGIRAP